jgi:hypothetical protein
MRRNLHSGQYRSCPECRSLLSEECSYDFLVLFIRSLTEVRVTHISTLIDEVKCWPVSILIGIPEDKVRIEDDRIVDFLFLYRGFDICSHFLVGELRRMDTDDDESLITVFLIPSIEIWSRSLTVDAPESPEIYEDDLPPESRHSEWRRVYPVSQSDLRSE